MEVAYRHGEKKTLFIAAVTLVVVGGLLIFSTWQGLQRQQEAVESHMLLTAQAVLGAVEGSLRRSMFRSNSFGDMMGMMQRGRRGGLADAEKLLDQLQKRQECQPGEPCEGEEAFDVFGDFRPDARAYFKELEESGEVLFVGVFDKGGGRILSSSEATDAEGGIELHLPKGALETLAETTRWHGMVDIGGKPAFVYGQQTRAGLARLLRPGFPFRNPHAFPQVFLLVGLDTTRHMGVFRDYKRTALYQTAYVLAAALLVWFMALGFLRRRELAGKAVFLEQFQSRLLDNLPDGLLTVDGDGVIRSANPAAHAIMGSEADTLVGARVEELPFGPEGGGLCTEAGEGWRRCEENGRSLEVLALAMDDEAGAPGRLVLVRDRTRMVSLEERLGEAKKLAAVGTLAAGVAHEIRNPLSALRGLAQHFAKKFAGREPEETYASTMVRESDRLNRVVTDLLFLARPRPLEPAWTPLASLGEEIGRLLSMDLEEKDVALAFDFKAQDLYADRDAVKQALLNLVLNGVDAIRSQAGKGGTVTISAERVASDADADGRGVWLRVADDGPGMTPEQKAQAFEPFFTGKKTGTGLGLAIVHKTVRDHGGTAEITSEPGRGAVVGMFFPDQDDRQGADQ